VLSGKGPCDGLITRPEESYPLWRVVLCDQETSKNEEAKARYRAVENTTTMGCNARKTIILLFYVSFISSFIIILFYAFPGFVIQKHPANPCPSYFTINNYSPVRIIKVFYLPTDAQ
jgi:hypothetical protein